MATAAQAIHQFRLRELQPLLHKLKLGTSSSFHLPNPFLPHKNPDTGRWAPSKYSLRQQADLIKKARQSRLVHLMPPGPKLALAEWTKAKEDAQKERQVLVEVNKGKTDVVQMKPKSKAPTTKASLTSSSPPTVFVTSSHEIEWVGEYKEKQTPGAEIGNRLYAGKKRMFKGHKWERTREKRESTTKALLENMPLMIDRFRTTYHRKRPNPLSVPLASKSGKLPF